MTYSEAMESRLRTHRSLLPFLAAALLVHILVLSVPVTREAARQAEWTDTLRVALRAPQPTRPPPEPEPPRALAPVTEPVIEPPAVPVAEPPPSPNLAETVEDPVPALSARELVARQFLLDDAQTRRYLQSIDEARPAPQYQPARRESLDDVLNTPVLQLPFEDTRIYEVAYYEAGIGGAMDRFWDSVTVPFAFTTKNNTRIQCAWVLIFAGCSWGHKTLYHREARKRRHSSQDS